MSEQWETSIFPIVKTVLEDNTSDDEISDEKVIYLSNLICQEIDKKYKIEKK